MFNSSGCPIPEKCVAKAIHKQLAYTKGPNILRPQENTFIFIIYYLLIYFLNILY